MGVDLGQRRLICYANLGKQSEVLRAPWMQPHRFPCRAAPVAAGWRLLQPRTAPPGASTKLRFQFKVPVARGWHQESCISASRDYRIKIDELTLAIGGMTHTGYTQLWYMGKHLQDGSDADRCNLRRGLLLALGNLLFEKGNAGANTCWPSELATNTSQSGKPNQGIDGYNYILYLYQRQQRENANITDFIPATRALAAVPARLRGQGWGGHGSWRSRGIWDGSWWGHIGWRHACSARHGGDGRVRGLQPGPEFLQGPWFVFIFFGHFQVRLGRH